MEDFLYIGRVANAHGVQGVIKIIPTTDDPHRFELLEQVYIEDLKGKTCVYTIQKVQYLKNFVLLTLKEVKDMNAALLLKQGIVKIPRSLALPLEEDEYYISDLIGLEVYDEDAEKIGTLKDIIFTGSNDVYVVDDKTKNGLLVPAIKECVKLVDQKQNKIIIDINFLK